MINWTQLITKDKKAVISFAKNDLSSKDFQGVFAGTPNPARCVVRDYGTLYGRRLARKALKRRGITI